MVVRPEFHRLLVTVCCVTCDWQLSECLSLWFYLQREIIRYYYLQTLFLSFVLRKSQKSININQYNCGVRVCECMCVWWNSMTAASCVQVPSSMLMPCIVYAMSCPCVVMCVCLLRVSWLTDLIVVVLWWSPVRSSQDLSADVLKYNRPHLQVHHQHRLQLSLGSRQLILEEGKSELGIAFVHCICSLKQSWYCKNIVMLN